MKYISYILFVAAILLVSCDKEEIEYTATGKLSGDWFVQYSIESQPGSGNFDELLVDYSSLSTYNTAANVSTEMFVDDHANFWDFKVKSKANPAGLSFGSPDELDNLKYESKVKVIDGKIFPMAATAPSGVKADSICFYVQFNDDETPYTHTYKVAGYKRTGWSEDEH